MQGNRNDSLGEMPRAPQRPSRQLAEKTRVASDILVLETVEQPVYRECVDEWHSCPGEDGRAFQTGNASFCQARGPGAYGAGPHGPRQVAITSCADLRPDAPAAAKLADRRPQQMIKNCPYVHCGTIPV